MSWEMVKLGDLCKMNSGGTPSRAKLEFYGGEILWAKISDIESSNGVIYNTDEHLTEKGLNAINNRVFEKGTLLLAMYGSVGKIAFAGTKMSSNQAILGIRINDETLLNYSYLKSWFTTMKEKLLYRAVGGTLQNISLGIVKDLQIPLPPLSTQKRIAEILDKADALRKKDQQLLKYYDELAQSLFIDLFGDPVKNEKGWEVKKLKNLGKVTTGNTPKREVKKYYGDFIEWIKTDNISYEATYPTKASEYLSVEGLKVGRYVDANSVLVTCIAGSIKSVGNVVLTDRKVSFNQQINAFTPLEGNALFTYFLFKYCKGLIQENTTNGMKRIITKSMFENIQFINPPISIQNQFATQIQNIEQQKERLKIQIQASEHLFQALLKQAFNGGLSV